ncbi:hypothetical protein [Streptosporangium sp. NPDC049376]|uniref:hypothetical protein n=1 Tax=Streptosporangium sp. NPDC049376 TaxID=3366192 RepID=UPI003799836A
MLEESVAEAPDSVFRPLPWITRAMGLPLFPGTYTEWPELLRSLLKAFTPETLASNRIMWPQGSDSLTAGEAAKTIRRTGLITLDGPRILVTPLGRRWQASGDDELLTIIFHCNIRFIGELLLALSQEGALTHNELMEMADTRYGLHWKSDTQIRNRTNWLRTLGILDFYNKRLHLTEAGRRVLDKIEVASPLADAELPASSISDPAPAVAELLGTLDAATLADRARGGMLYLPRGKKYPDKLEILTAFAELAIPAIKTTDLKSFCVGEFNIQDSSADSVIGSLKALGIIEQVSSDSWSTTALAKSWLEGEDPLDLARIAHANVWYFGEILHDLDDPSISHYPKALVQRSANYHPEGRGLIDTAINSRVSILIACGLIEKLRTTDYRVTSLGRLFRSTILCQDIAYPSEPGSEVDATPQTAADTSPGAASDAQTLADEIEAASIDSANHQRLERAAVAAFNYLGMPSNHIGGSGRPDGTVRTGIGVQSQLLTLETKSSATGRVSEEAANLLGLPEHREKAGAAHTLLVGPGFDRRLQQAADKDPNIAVILASLLADTVRRQAITPLTVMQLAPLVDPALSCAQRDATLSELWRREERRSKVEHSVIEVLEEEALNPLQEGGWLDLTSIRRELRRYDFLASEEEVLEALRFLTSPRIAVVEESKHGYRSSMPKAAIARRIRAIGEQWQQTSG